MNRPINPALYRRPRSVPALVLVDMQQEYEIAGRPLALAADEVAAGPAEVQPGGVQGDAGDPTTTWVAVSTASSSLA